MSQVRANSITNAAGTGAPDFPNGLTTGGSAPSYVPAGAVMTFAMNTAPTGWLKANGAAVSRTTYATLFAAIGTTFGVGDGSTTFNLPDMRGQFTRNWADNGSIDSGRAFGSTQADQMQQHRHVSGYPRASSFAYANSVYGTVSAGSMYPSTATTSLFACLIPYTDYQGGTSNSSENRPTNIALLACIKY